MDQELVDGTGIIAGMKSLRRLALALLIAHPAQAIDLPDLGDAARATLTESHEDRIGREVMRQIRGTLEYLDDPVLHEYLSALGERLVAASPEPGRRFEFFPIRDASINAFALPGGYIGVHTGLIAAARNESELAGVLAHEIAHVTQNHIARIVDAQRSGALVSMVALAVAILAARASSDVSQAALATAQAVSIQNQLDFTREHEREADRIGLQTLVAAGFAPQGMVTFFERLQAHGRLYENNAPAYLRTHPLTVERIADMQNRVANMPYRQHVDGLDFRFARARVQVAQGEPADALRRMQAQAREQPDAGNTYGLALAHLRVGDAARAQTALDALPADAAAAPQVTLLRTEIALARGDAAEAVRISGAALARDSGYRPLAHAHARALLRANQPRRTLDFLREWQRTWSVDATLHRLRAQAHQALGERAQSHLAQAEAHALEDRLGAAIEQLRIAQRAGDADFYTLSIIDARLRQLGERQRAETARR
jgi:predicted Zn-dependent protease